MLRVVTLNIWNLNFWRERRDGIAAWLTRLEPDVVSLQEVVRNTSDGRCQATWLAERTGHEVAFAGGLDVGDSVVGNAVLSRFPIAASDSVRLSAGDEPDEGRVCVRADLETPKGLLTVFGTHLNWQFHHGMIRETQVQEVAAFVDTRPSTPLPPILAGDFNAEPESTEIRYLKGLHSIGGRSSYLQDAYEVARAPQPGFTWSNVNPYAAATMEPDRRIDYIFVGWRHADGTGVVEHAEVTCNEPDPAGTWPTDHLGVLADIRF